MKRFTNYLTLIIALLFTCLSHWATLTAQPEAIVYFGLMLFSAIIAVYVNKYNDKTA